MLKFKRILQPLIAGVIASMALVCSPASVAMEAEQTFEIQAAEITAYGIFTLAGVQKRAGFRSNALPADSGTGARFTDFTSTVVAELGTNFGFRYRINSTPRGRPIGLRYVIRFPGEGLVTPSGSVYTTSEESLKIRIGEESYYGYGFDEPWEMVPGDWIFEVWYGQARLINKVFTVELPAEPSSESERADWQGGVADSIE